MTTTKSNGPLDILVSARIRLTQEERETLKSAYFNAKRAEVSEQAPSPNGSQIKVISANLSGTALDSALGMSQLVVTDLLNSRDSLNLPLVIHFQNVLGVEVINEKRLLAACKSYCSYVFNG